MSASHDRKFFDTFMLVLGILAAVTIALMVLAGIISDRTAKTYYEEDPLRQEETLDRIAPVTKVAVAGKDNSALAAPAAAPTASRSTCRVTRSTSRCARRATVPPSRVLRRRATRPPGARASHRATDTLYKHAIEGFQGKAGFMPPKGGRTDLSDQSVRNAVDYLVSQSR